MDDNQLLDVCLSITGRFEGGTPSYTALVGDFDGAGMSAGILQFNPLSGTLQKLVSMIGTAMGWTKAKAFFVSDIEAFSKTSPKDGVAFVKAHYLDAANPKKLAPAATVAWKAFLSSEEGVAAQRSYAESTVLSHAKRLALQFVPEYATRSRSIAFFFDLCTQQGSMTTIKPVPNPSAAACLAFAKLEDPACAAIWQEAALTDPLAQNLLYYGYERARQARSLYVWDCLSRRGTIAARKGIADKTHMDFTAQLD
jgi:hypothetical protein